MVEKSKILMVADENPISRYLFEELIIKRDCSVSREYSVQSALEIFKHGTFDVIIVGFGSPDLDSVALVKGLKRIDPDCIIIAFVGESNPDAASEILSLGVYDLITSPFNLEKLSFNIRKGAELRSVLASHRKLTQSIQEQNMALQKQNLLFAKRIEESTKNLIRLYEDLRSTYMRTIKALAQTIDARDHYTHSHSENVAKYAVAIAEEMSFSTNDIEMVREACELHDIGKIGIGDTILSKPAELSPDEMEQIRLHPETAVKILEPLNFLGSVVDLVRQHHEHYDGTGYPGGRKGEDIAIGARVIHLADAYDAMRSARSYRKIPLTKEEAIYEIKKNTGTQFDPKVVEAFLKIVDKLETSK
jgi:putative nucleotidyltransferase with HDIG domain